MVRRVAVAWALALTLAASANAQSGSSGTSTGQNTAAQSSSTATTDTRPATTTFYGDTGLWYVPTAEVLAHGKWSVSGYRRGTNFIDRYPRVNQYWTGDNVGDFYVGAKVNLWSEYRQNPVALAFRGMVKLPTA